MFWENGITKSNQDNSNNCKSYLFTGPNGNMTVMPGLNAKYDAWNRLVEVRDSSDNLISRYDYNGMNQRIVKMIGATVTK
jgi:hypothetical protein